VRADPSDHSRPGERRSCTSSWRIPAGIHRVGGEPRGVGVLDRVVQEEGLVLEAHDAHRGVAVDGFHVDGAPHCLPLVYRVWCAGRRWRQSRKSRARRGGTGCRGRRRVAAIGVAPVPLLGAAGLDVAVVPHAAAAMLRTASKLRTLVVLVASHSSLPMGNSAQHRSEELHVPQMNAAPCMALAEDQSV